MHLSCAEFAATLVLSAVEVSDGIDDDNTKAALCLQGSGFGVRGSGFGV